MVRSARTQMTGEEVSRRFASKLRVSGWEADGLQMGFDFGAATYLRPPVGYSPKIPRAVALAFAKYQSQRQAIKFFKLHCEELGMIPDLVQAKAFGSGFFKGMYLGLRLAAERLLPGQESSTTEYSITVFKDGAACSC